MKQFYEIQVSDSINKIVLEHAMPICCLWLLLTYFHRNATVPKAKNIYYLSFTRKVY